VVGSANMRPLEVTGVGILKPSGLVQEQSRATFSSNQRDDVPLLACGDEQLNMVVSETMEMAAWGADRWLMVFTVRSVVVCFRRIRFWAVWNIRQYRNRMMASGR
jgi:hypothetical protein